MVNIYEEKKISWPIKFYNNKCNDIVVNVINLIFFFWKFCVRIYFIVAIVSSLFIISK